MGARLTDSSTGEPFELEDFNLIGRGGGATLRFDDASMSREHASIRRQSSSWWITDLGSSNGTYINDLRLGSPRKLQGGDVLRFGTRKLEFWNDGERAAMDDSTLLQTQVLTQTMDPVRTVSATLLVGDLVGFTTMSEKLGASELARTVNQWYDHCRTVVTEEGGQIDKFVGDCVFAYWHGKGPRERQAALSAARTLTGAPAAFTETRLLALDENAIDFSCNVGLHVGEVAIGGGTSDDVTALGDAVNLAFRVETLTRDLDEPVLVTADFVEGAEVEEGTFRSRGVHALKGVTSEVEVFGV